MLSAVFKAREETDAISDGDAMVIFDAFRHGNEGQRREDHGQIEADVLHVLRPRVPRPAQGFVSWCNGDPSDRVFPRDHQGPAQPGGRPAAQALQRHE
eukprot:482454-Pyramimonas_sp.AAC.1